MEGEGEETEGLRQSFEEMKRLTRETMKLLHSSKVQIRMVTTCNGTSLIVCAVVPSILQQY